MKCLLIILFPIAMLPALPGLLITGVAVGLIWLDDQFAGCGKMI